MWYKAKEAVFHFKKVLEINPNFEKAGDVHYYIGYLYFWAGYKLEDENPNEIALNELKTALDLNVSEENLGDIL
jgi:tetratricopeptide (TPR) repeat protein